MLLFYILVIVTVFFVCNGTIRSSQDVYKARARSLIGAVTSSLASVVAAQKVYAKTSLAPPTLGVSAIGSLQLCPNAWPSACTSSQDDRPAAFMPPWEYDGNLSNAKRKLTLFVTSLPNSALVFEQDSYLRFLFEDTKLDTVDDVEFYFPPNDSIIHYRSCRRGVMLTDFGVNKNRIEVIRRALGFENIAVLRNRRRFFFFGESSLDTFGPPTSIFEDAIDNLSGDMMSLQFSDQDKKYRGVLSDSTSIPLWETNYNPPIGTLDARYINFGSSFFIPKKILS